MTVQTGLKFAKKKPNNKQTQRTKKQTEKNQPKQDKI